MIFTSSITVHARSQVINADVPIQPQSHYAMSKYLAEELCRIADINFCTLRISGIYGVGGPEHLGLNKALTQAVSQKKPPLLCGSGACKRNYISVEDTAKWILHLVENPAYQQPCSRQILYLADTEHISIYDYLAQLVDALLPGQSLITEPGNEASDVIVEPSPPPFPLTPYQQYLNQIACNK
jgi:nucleoside-diphosphate-sugar epimerase